MIDKTKWKNIEKNIWQNIENPKKFMLILYYGRDARGRMKKSSKTMYGTLTEARNMLKQHDVDRLHENVNVPAKCTLLLCQSLYILAAIAICAYNGESV